MAPSNTVAIVGIGGIFPQSRDLDQFWDHIQRGQCTAREVPAGRWSVQPERIYDPEIAMPDKVYSTHGCFVDDDMLDCTGTGLDLPDGLLAGLDPMFKLGLRVAKAAYDDAGLAGRNLERAGVIIGNIVLPTDSASSLTREYLGRLFEEAVTGGAPKGPSEKTDPLNRYVAGLPAGLIARALGFGGSAFTLDAACASSLYALKLAIDMLLSYRADVMISGGLSRPDCLYTQMGFAQLRALSPSGKPSPFGWDADGLVVGEGAGMFVLKRLADALADRDHIYGLVAGIGLSNDRDGSLLAPSSEGQLRAMRAAYREAGWSPGDVSLLECHATGTPLGDQVELESMCSLWADAEHPPDATCVIGSVKSNVGHLLTAAGAAALMKVLLALKHRTLPPIARFSGPSPKTDLERSPFRILSQPEPWHGHGKEPRRAAISAFGFGGINAHVLIEEWTGSAKSVDTVPLTVRGEEAGEPIAIVGMDVHFGPWQTLEAFRERVFGEGPDVGPTEPHWWGAERSGWFREMGASPPLGHYIHEVSVPFSHFRIPPNELLEMLPQQLLMLHVADRALRDAGSSNRNYLDAGVYVGIGLDFNTTNFQLRWVLESQAQAWCRQKGVEPGVIRFQAWLEQLRKALGPALNANRTVGALGGMVASRIARELRFGGPSFTLSSEETSGISALDAALIGLRQGQISLALVGAVDFPGDLRMTVPGLLEGLYAHRGTAKPFDREADGAVPGEGAAALVLKRLDQARRDGDRVYAVIKGLGSASGGMQGSSGRDAATHERALREAYKDAHVEPSRVGYLETFARGSAHQDIAESDTPGDFFQGASPALGSVKADVGQTGAASALASVVKAVLALRDRVIPPPRQFDNSSREGVPMPPESSSPSPVPWLRNRAEGPRLAGVNAFAVGGGYSHIVLEEVSGEARRLSGPPLGQSAECLFFSEGNDTFELARELTQWRGELAENQADIVALAWNRPRRTDPNKARAVAFVASDRDQLLHQIDMVLEALRGFPHDPMRFQPLSALQRKERVFFDEKPLGPEAKVAFVFPGSGSHFPGMGRDLALRWPKVFQRQDMASAYFREQMNPELFWYGLPIHALHRDHESLLSAQVGLGIAMSDLVRSFEVKPSAMIGYSLGESVALFASGAWSDRDAMHLRTKQSNLFKTALAGPCTAARQTWGLAAGEDVDWVIGVVNRSADLVRAALAGSERVYLLIINTPSECVVGGDRRAVDDLVKTLKARLFPLHGVVTVHCEVVKPVASAYRDHHLFETHAPEGIRFYSGAGGCSYQVTRETAADAILAQALHGVDFPRTIRSAYEDGYRIFLEMGPGSSCSRMIGRILGDQPHLAQSVCYPCPDPVAGMLKFLARLITARVPLNLEPLYSREIRVTSHEGPQLMRIPVGGEPFNVPAFPLAELAGNDNSPREESSAAETVPPETQTRNQALVAGEVLSTSSSPTIRAEEEGVGATPSLMSEASLSRPAVDSLAKSLHARSRAHGAFLRFSQQNNAAFASQLERQIALTRMLPANGSRGGVIETGPLDHRGLAKRRPSNPELFMDRVQCLEFAVGSIAALLGEEFKIVDTHPTRVRLPDEPLMLVDRILDVGGSRMRNGFVVTEHDVLPGGWYLDCDRIPTCIAVEAGQADLFLSAYLGIDFETEGLAMYRLLDAVVTFHRELPRSGQVIRYSIQIEKFFRQGATYLFRFSFEGSVDGEPLLSMQEGCAGFFSRAELEAGKGIVKTELQRRETRGALPADWESWVPMTRESYDKNQIEALRDGDLAGCFGDLFRGLPLERPMGLPGGRMKLVDRVTVLEPEGGRFGLGLIRAEADIDPHAWFLTCHFVDDRVMPGTLMYECCLHGLRIFLYRLGWVGEASEVVCQPVPGIGSRLKCRGQVLETTRTVTYEVVVKELGYRPEPFAVVDALMYADEKPIVEITDMSYRMSGLSRERLQEIWAGPRIPDRESRKALFDRERILAFAVGKPSRAFGEPYRIFDRERVIARLPGPPFMFLDRIVETEALPWQMKAGGVIEAEYDVPPDAWYFAADRQKEMSFAVLLEVALQPCGWFAGYMGSALTSDADLSFRNLGGNAVKLRPVNSASGTLRIRIKVTRVSASGGMIIQNYDYEIFDKGGSVYKGDTYFGFFSKVALANQVGIRDAEPYQPGRAERKGAESFDYPTSPPFPGSELCMIDRIEAWLPDGGPHGLGWIQGSMAVKPDAWFFKAHFYQDSVVPGSLGLESMLQLMKVVASRRWGVDETTCFQVMVPAETHQWVYRGQVIPGDRRVTVQAAITRVDERERRLHGEGFLSVDGRVIYQMKGFTLQLGPASGRG